MRNKLKYFSYFYLYRLSYLYSVVIGFVITLTIGYLASRLFEKLNIDGTDRVYINGDKTTLNYDLFFPPIARRLRIQHAKRERLLSNSNNLTHVRNSQMIGDMITYKIFNLPF